MKIAALGASVMFGDELASPDHVWPALYAASRGLKFENLSQPRIGPQAVLRTLVSSLSRNSDPTLYIIHWPTPIRWEYVDRDTDSWIQVSPNSQENQVKKIYYSEINSQLGDKWNLLLFIYSAQQLLNASPHQWVMTLEDDMVYDRRWHNPDYVSFLQDSTESTVSKFEGQCWARWTEFSGFKRGPYGHPLEPAHVRAFELFAPQYDQLIAR